MLSFMITTADGYHAGPGQQGSVKVVNEGCGLQ